jgi:hypothetical protein
MPSAEVLSYYDSMIAGMTGASSEAAIDGDHRSRRRYHIVPTENASRFPDSMSLTQLVMYSPRCLKQISRIVQDRPSYIVPGVVSAYEKQLCTHLGIPLLGNDPNVHPQHCNRISARKFFTSMGAMVPGGTLLAPLMADAGDPKRMEEFERLKRKALERLDSLAAKRRRAFNRLDAAMAVSNGGTDDGDDASASAQQEAEAELLQDIPGVFICIDLAIEQKYPDLVGLWVTIATTMMRNLHTKRWLLKLADQTDGRGQAAIHSADFQRLREAIEERRRWGCKQDEDSVPRNAVLDFAAELALELPRLARLSRSAQVCYGSWDNFFDTLTRSGAVLEETPGISQADVIGCSASLVIRPSSPDGRGDDWELLQLVERRSVMDDLTIHGDGPTGMWSFPLGCQDGTPDSSDRAHRKLAAERTARARRAAVHMLKLCKLAAPELARLGVRGYVTIDAIAFNASPPPRRQQQLDADDAVDNADGHDADDNNRPLTPVPEVRASVELWATDICYGYTDRLVSWEVAHSILQGRYLPGSGIYSIRKDSMRRCMAGCRIISPHIDMVLGGRGGGLKSFFRWANISGQRQFLEAQEDDDGSGGGGGSGSSDAAFGAGALGCQYDISQQLGGLFSLPPCANDGIKQGSTRSTRHQRSLLRKTDAPDTMALTVVAADTASSWSMLRNTLDWLERTSHRGPARAVAQESTDPLSPRPGRAASPPRVATHTAERREEEDNLQSLCSLSDAVACTPRANA